MIELALLGPFEVRLDGRPVPLRPKQRALLAVLALRAGETVSLDRLINDLWGEQPPATATASLQNAVSLVRRSLGGGVLVTQGGGYALAVEREQVDAFSFERLVAEAQEARAQARADILRRALALWRGPALGDLAFEPFAATEAPRLDELRLSAREQLAEAEFALGRHEAVLGELETLIESSPFRERPRALLMLALYRSGRQADALEAFQATRRVLREQLGLEPSPALRAIQAAMLRQDPALDPPEAAQLPYFVGEERRKTVTVFFCDLVESTALAATLDPEVYRAVLRRYYRAARDVLEGHGGTVEKFVGDAVVAVFGVPTSHEDDALRAVRAAVQLRGRVASLNTELEQAHGVALRTRMGVNTGEVISGEPETGQSFATGYVVNVAAKLQQAAPADGILLGAATYRLVRDAVVAEPVEPLALGRAAAPIPAFLVGVVDAEAPGVARNLEAPLVGRGDELAALGAAFDAAKDTGTARVTTVVGEAGIGKSRLAAELAALVEGEATVLIGRCVSYGEGATYLPVVEIVRRLVPDGSEAGIAALLPDDADARLVAQRIRELLGWAEGAPPPGEGFWAVRRLLEASARARPLLLVLEDVHWAEPTLLDLVDHLAEQAAGPMLVLCLARPDLLEARPSWQARVVLRLGPLSDHESAELLDGLTSVPAETRRRIVEIADGNALFVEQLHAYAVETGDDGLESVPATIDALLASRLDRLPDDERAVLERAAVLGREFWRGAVADLAGRDAETSLAALAERGLVRRARSQLAGEEALAFHHVLVRDVAYAGITKERRAKLHERAAAWLDAHAEVSDAIVGYHLEQAYRLRTALGAVDDETRSVGTAAGERLSRGGIQAWKRADAPAAVNLLGRALALPGEGETRGELLCELAQARRLLGRIDEAEATLEEALEAGRATGNGAVELRARLDRLGIELFVHRRASCEDALAEASAAIPVLQELGADRALGRAWLLIGDVHAMRCRMTAWGDAYAEALRYYRRAEWSPVVSVEGIAASAAHGPIPVDAGLDRCRALRSDADDLASQAAIGTWEAALEAMQGEFDAAHALLERADEINAELGRERSSSHYVRGYALLLAGRPSEAAKAYSAAYRLAERQRELAVASSHGAELAAVLVDLGRGKEAESVRGRARGWAHPEDTQAAFLWRLVDAKLAAATGSFELALEHGADALRLAESTDAVAYRAWIATEVARIHASQGGRRAVNRLLREAETLYGEKGHLAGVAAVRVYRDQGVATPA